MTNTMTTSRRSLVLSVASAVAVTCALTWTSRAAFAQEAPAIAAAATAEEKARVGKLIDDAKKEGELVYWDTVIQPETHDALAAAFRKAYGLAAAFKVTYNLQGTAALATRVEQELAAGKVTMDIASVASLPWMYERVQKGDVAQYASPAYAKYTKAFENGLGVDGYFAFNGAYIFVPMWNAQKLDFKGKSWKDVIGAVPEGRISVGDAGKSLTYLATYHGHAQVLDDAFFKALAGMKPSFLMRSEQIAQRLVTGEDLMAFSAMPTRAYQNNQKGAQLKFLLPEEGVVLLPQSMIILAKAPHPAAARLWIDFVLSEQGQDIIVKGEAMMSGRDGYKSPLPDYAPGIDTLKLVKVDWKGVSTEMLKDIRGAWAKIFAP